MGTRGPHAGTEKRGPPTGIRFDPALKARLKAAADASERTFSEEVSARLQMSFGANDWFGDVETYALCQLIALALRDVGRYSGAPWHRHPWSYGQASTAVAEVMGHFKPDESAGEASHPLGDDFSSPEAKATLQNFRLGEAVALQAVHRLMALTEHSDIQDADRLHVIAAGLLDRLMRTGTAENVSSALDKLIKEGSS
jgi:hypothetical protein